VPERRQLPLRWGVELALVVSLAFGVVAGFYELHDPDVWWVAAAGRLTLQTGAIPVANTFSFTEPGHPWLMHEWLLGIPYARLMESLGPSGFAFLTLLQATVAMAILAHFFYQETERASAFLFLYTLTLFLFGVRFLTLRPTHVALLVALVFTVIAYRPGFSLRRILALALVELLWTNVHGSFVMGLFLCASSILVYPREWGLRSAALAVTTLATLVNPFGLHEHQFVLDYFLGRSDVYRMIHVHIADFAPLYRLSPVGEPFLFLEWIALAAGTAWAMRTKEYRRAAIVVVLALAAFKNVRHMDLAGIVSMIVLTPVVDSAFQHGTLRAALARASGQRPLGIRGPLLPYVLWISPLSLGIAVLVWQCARTRSTERFVTPDGTPGAAWTLALRRVPDGANLFVPFDAGGVAIWFASPRGVRVFYDPRNDCYSADVAEQAFRLEFASAKPAELAALLVRYGTTHLVLPKSHVLARSLASDPTFVQESSAGPLIVFRRADTPG
jgi:hypothetical protein